MWNSFSLTNIRTLHHWISLSYILLLWSETNSLPMGTQRTIITSVLSIWSNHNKIPKTKIILTSGSNIAFGDILTRNVTTEEYQKHQQQHKKNPRDIKLFEEHDTPVSYQIQYDDDPNNTCNNFYSIHCKQGNDNNDLGLHNDGENFTLNSPTDKFPSTTIQVATDCFRRGRTSTNSDAYAYPQRNLWVR